MDAFKRKLKARIAWLSAAILFITATYFILLFRDGWLSFAPLPDYGKEFATGTFAGLLAVMLTHILKTAVCLNNDEKVKTLYIRENDERRLLIMQKTGSHGFRISSVGLGFAAVIASFFNTTVALSLLGAILFLLLVKVSLWLYYVRRY
jgi:uncharacterized membrane protein